ncbi:arginine kinase Oct f 2-like [Babylonia areolata]|uniref:arginine kinase Oct f 2-like n=1 Tax=Babylonia areolata TaxID=304850 RepID=UPI003FD55CE6
MSDTAALWAKLQSKESKSLLKKNLTQKEYDELKDKKTKFGGTLAECIRSGCENPESGVGIYACDPDGYTVFAPVLDKVIKDYHKVGELKHPKPSFGETEINFGDLDPSGEMIVSTRVRVGRSHDSFGFPPVLSKEDRIEMEKKTVEALNTLEGDLNGTYYPLLGMSKEVQNQLTEDHFLFNDSDRFLKAAGGYDDWPIGRGIFHTPDKKFLVWVNEEDHLRLISMQKGGNLKEVYLRLVKAIQTLEKKLSFAKKDNLGYLTFCPSNLGTALRASVHIKIPKLAATPDFKEFCDKLHIQARGIHGEHTESVGGVYDISNKRRLGLSEFDAIQEMRKGVEEVIQKEKSL